MGSAHDPQKLYADHGRALSAQRFREQNLDYARLEQHMPLPERLDAVEDISVALYDLHRRSRAHWGGRAPCKLTF